MNAFARILILVLLTLPLVALFLLPAGTAAQAIWFWPFAMLILLLLWFLIGRPRDEDVPVAAGPRPLSLEDEPPAIRRHMDVDEAVELPEGVRVFRGTLREDADQAYDSIKREADPGVVPLLQPDRGGRTALFLLPRAVEQRSLEHKVRPGIHLLLLFLTFLTTTFAGAAHQGVTSSRIGRRRGRRKRKAGPFGAFWGLQKSPRFLFAASPPLASS
jgi:hypothetical protein